MPHGVVQFAWHGRILNGVKVVAGSTDFAPMHLFASSKGVFLSEMLLLFWPLNLFLTDRMSVMVEQMKKAMKSFRLGVRARLPTRSFVIKDRLQSKPSLCSHQNSLLPFWFVPPRREQNTKDLACPLPRFSRK